MKPITILSIAFILSLGYLNAQSVFLKGYGDATSNFTSGRVTDSQGNSFFVGNFYGESMQFGDILIESDFDYTPYLLKMDNDGNPLWAIAEASAGKPKFYDIALDHENNIIICGEFYADDAILSGITLSTNGDNAFIAKYNPNGDIIWAKSISGESLTFKKLAIDKDNNILFLGENAGALNFLGNDVEVFGDYDIIYGKYDKNGNSLWLKSLGSSSGENANAIATDNSNNILISVNYGGNFSIDGIAVMDLGLSDAALIKTNGLGEALWVKTISGPSDNCKIADMVADASDDIYVIAEAASDDLVFGTAVSNYGLSDIYTLKLHGDDGAVSWYKFGGGSSYDHAESIALATDGVFVTGNFGGAAEFDGLQLYTDFSAGFIIAYHLNGDITQVYNLDGNSFVSPDKISTDQFGNVYCSGTFFDNIIIDDAPELFTEGNADIFMYKFNSSLVGISAADINPIQVSIYPNPTTNLINILCGEGVTSQIEISILNATGQIVNQLLNANPFELQSFDVSNLPAGLYAISIRNNNRIINSQKFLKL